MPALHSTITYTHTIDQHIRELSIWVERGLRDPESRQLAVKIVSGTVDSIKYDRATGEEYEAITAWGKNFRAPGGDLCKPKDPVCEIEKIWDFLVLNFRYVYDSVQLEIFATLQRSLEAGGGDCDDACIAFATLFKCLGFHVGARVIATKADPKEWVHIYPLVGLPKDDPSQWIPLDITVEGALPGWEYGGIAKYKDFLL